MKHCVGVFFSNPLQNHCTVTTKLLDFDMLCCRLPIKATSHSTWNLWRDFYSIFLADLRARNELRIWCIQVFLVCFCVQENATLIYKFPGHVLLAETSKFEDIAVGGTEFSQNYAIHKNQKIQKSAAPVSKYSSPL